MERLTLQDCFFLFFSLISNYNTDGKESLKNQPERQKGRRRALALAFEPPRLTCALGPAHKRGPRRAGAALAGPGQQHADVVLRVRVQVPQLVGDHVDGVHLGPGRLAGAVLDLFADDGAVPQDGVGVELHHQVSGAGAEQLRRRDGRRRHCQKK